MKPGTYAALCHYCATNLALKCGKSPFYCIREAALLGLAVLGGSIGAWLGMKVWHHKTLHKKFRFGVPLILMYFRQKGCSVIVPAIMHGTFNAVVPLSAIVVMPMNDLLYGAAGLAGFIVLLIMDVFLYLYDRYISKEKVFATVL